MTIPFKAVAVDMDGTFLNDQRNYDHDLFAQVLNKLEKSNIQFIVASGRPFARLKNDFSEFIDRVDFVTANGSRLIVEGKEVAVEGLTKKQTIDLINFVHHTYGSMATMAYGRETAYIGTEAPAKDKEFLQYFAKESVEISDWQELPDDTFIELTFHHDSKIAGEIEKKFNEQYGNIVTTFASNPVAIDAVKHGINKATGLKKLLAYFGLTGEDLIAFGDSGNDIPMLDFAKYSYAMENGMAIAKEHAKYLAPSNNDNGVIDPISKVQIDGDRCLLYTGENAKTIAQINHLLGKLKSNHLPIYVCTKNTNEKSKIFGIKINLVKGQVYIL